GCGKHCAAPCYVGSLLRDRARISHTPSPNRSRIKRGLRRWEGWDPDSTLTVTQRSRSASDSFTPPTHSGASKRSSSSRPSVRLCSKHWSFGGLATHYLVQPDGRRSAL